MRRKAPGVRLPIGGFCVEFDEESFEKGPGPQKRRKRWENSKKDQEIRELPEIQFFQFPIIPIVGLYSAYNRNSPVCGVPWIMDPELNSDVAPNPDLDPDPNSSPDPNPDPNPDLDPERKQWKYCNQP